MSHELRTPLNGVLGYAQLLQRDRSLNAGAARGARRDRQVRRAPARPDQRRARPVEDRGRARRHRGDAPTDLRAADHRSQVRGRRGGAPQGPAARRMTIAPDVPRRVVLDGRHLRQVLLNLLGNAVKFTAQGEVRLAIAGDGDDRLLLRGERHRHRHRARRAGQDLRGVHADARRRRGRRHRPRPDHQPAPVATHGRRAAGREHARPGQPVLLRAAAGAGRRRQRGADERGRRRRAAARCAAGAGRARDGARRRRQHREPPHPRAACSRAPACG